MGITDIKQRLSDIPGIEGLTMQMLGGRQNYGIGGKIVSVDGGASDAVAMEAIRAAMSSSSPVQMPAGSSIVASDIAGPAPANAGAPVHTPSAPAINSAALLPPVNVTAQSVTLQPEAAPVTTPAPSSPAAHALTIKDVLSEHTQKLNQILQAQIVQLQATLTDQVDTVVSGTNAVIARSKQHTDDFKAILGQFSNLPDGF